MLSLALASFLAAPLSGGPWPVALRPAVVVPVEAPAPDLEISEGTDNPENRVSEAPRLAPAKSLPAKAKARKARPSTKPKPQGR